MLRKFILFSILVLSCLSLSCAMIYEMDSGWLNDGDEVYIDLTYDKIDASKKFFSGFLKQQQSRLARGDYYVERLDIGDKYQLRTYRDRGHVLACVCGGKVRRLGDPFDVAADTVTYDVRIISSGRAFNCLAMWSNKAERLVLARQNLEIIE